MSFFGAIGSMLGGALLGDRRENRQHKKSKEFMGMQLHNQKALNQQGQKLAMQTWRETNYPAQMKMMKEAGLNPALMYGQGGAGGTTNAGSGGSASMGSASQSKVMGIEGMLAQAQIENIKAQTEKTNAETENISEGGVTYKKTKMETSKIWQDIQQYGYESARKEMENQLLSNEVLAIEKNKNEWLKGKVGEWQKVGIENEANKMKIKLTEEQITQIMHKIWQDWVNAGSGVLASSSFIVNAIKGLTGSNKGKSTKKKITKK